MSVLYRYISLIAIGKAYKNRVFSLYVFSAVIVHFDGTIYFIVSHLIGPQPVPACLGGPV